MPSRVTYQERKEVLSFDQKSFALKWADYRILRGSVSPAPLQVFRHAALELSLNQIVFALFHQFPKARIFLGVLGVDSGTESEQRIQQRFGCVLVSSSSDGVANRSILPRR